MVWNLGDDVPSESQVSLYYLFRFIPNRSTTDVERSHQLLVTSMEASGGEKNSEEDELTLQEVDFLLFHLYAIGST